MYSIKDIVDDGFVNMDTSRKVVRHRRFNILMLVSLIVAGYFAFGKYSELLDQSRELQMAESIYTQKDDGGILDLKGSRSRSSYYSRTG